MSKKRNKTKKRKKQQKQNLEKKKQEILIENNNEVKKELNDKDKNKTKSKENSKKSKTIKHKKVKEKSTKNKKLKKIIIIIMVVIFSVVIGILAYLAFRPKFKDFTIELGTENVSVGDFLVSDMYSKWSSFVTDLNSIDFNEVQNKDIVLKCGNKKETVKLHIVDTTAPKVEFKDVTAYLDYNIVVDDFIVEKSDLSEMTSKIVNDIKIEDYGEYDVDVQVTDKYGNSTNKTCKLIITWLFSDVKVEMGTDFSVSNIVVDAERFGEFVPQTEIDKVNTMELGEYNLSVEYEGREYKSVVKVQDTTPPDLVLKNVKIWNDSKIGSYQEFIESVSDVSGEVTTEMLSTINYGIIGNQDIIIKAKDINGNEIEKTAVLTIRKDTNGPVIYGAKDLTIAKHSNLNLNAGVYAVDEKDGNCEVTSDGSSVNVDAAGTYYAKYTSKDAAGNVSTVNRKIIVNHDQEDTNRLVNEFYNNYCVGQDAVGISLVIRDRIKYKSNSGGGDPVYYALTEGSGNCIVHAELLHAVLNKAGYSNRIIYLTDRSHYWNLVNTGGVWRHLDATPSGNHSIGFLTDEQKLADVGLYGKTWNREAWPAAE